MGSDAGQFAFWKPKSAKITRPAEVFESLRKGEKPQSLADIDVEAVQAALKQAYRSFKPPQPVEIDLPRQQTAINITWSARHFAVFFEGDAFKQMDRVSLLMSNLGLDCYDILSDKLFSCDKPPRFIANPDEEARRRVFQKMSQERSHSILAEMGFPYDPKLKLSPGLAELFRSDPDRAKILNLEYMKRANAAINDPSFAVEFDRRMALRTAKISKKRGHK